MGMCVRIVRVWRKCSVALTCSCGGFERLSGRYFRFRCRPVAAAVRRRARAVVALALATASNAHGPAARRAGQKPPPRGVPETVSRCCSEAFTWRSAVCCCSSLSDWPRAAPPPSPPLLRAPWIEVAENGTMATSVRSVELFRPAARMLSPSYAECPRRLCGECAE